MRGQKHEWNGVGQEVGGKSEVEVEEKEEDRKGYVVGGNEIGRNHHQEGEETGQEEPKGNRKQLQQATNLRSHEERCGRTGGPRGVGKPSREKCSGSEGRI
jgi:hypothetical protein